MLLISRAQANTLALTLTEKSTLENPVYLFEFNNDNSKESFFFIAADISTHKERYNRFVITETSAPDTLIGQVSLPLDGYYHYTVREQASSTNLDPTLSGSIVEIGKVLVVSTRPANTVYDGENVVNKVYNG